jgi:hypothetical protein
MELTYVGNLSKSLQVKRSHALVRTDGVKIPYSGLSALHKITRIFS